jgi:hypothetical protein
MCKSLTVVKLEPLIAGFKVVLQNGDLERPFLRPLVLSSASLNAAEAMIDIRQQLARLGLDVISGQEAGDLVVSD